MSDEVCEHGHIKAECGGCAWAQIEELHIAYLERERERHEHNEAVLFDLTRKREQAPPGRLRRARRGAMR